MSISKEFSEEIKAFKEPLFYNTTGSTEAYKLCIRHISASMSAGLAKLNAGFIYPNEILYVVDLENEEIEKISEPIALVKLGNLD